MLQLALLAHLLVDAGDVELVAAAGLLLGQGHGLLGALQQVLGAVAVLGEQGDAQAGAQGDFLLADEERPGQVVEQALRQFGGLAGVLEGDQDQRELVAAHARQGGEMAVLHAQAIGGGAQQLVAALVAVAFVDRLEVVEAQAEDRHPVQAALGIDEDLLQLLLQLYAVGQAGELVDLAQALQGVFRLAVPRAVAGHAGQQAVGAVDPLAEFVVLVAARRLQLGGCRDGRGRCVRGRSAGAAAGRSAASDRAGRAARRAAGPAPGW